jgi:hypothetical protein
VLDVDDAHPAPGDPYAGIKYGFAAAKGAVASHGGAEAVIQAYHATLVAPFCMVAARGFFGQF